MLHRLALVVVIGAITGCPSFEKPSLSVESAKIAAADFNGATVNVDVTIDNPNPIPLFADRLAFQGFFEEKPLTKGELTKRVSVPAKGKASVTVPLRFVYKELGQAAAAMKDKERWHYEVKGEVGFEPHEKIVITLPFANGGDLPAPRLPKVSTERARVEEPSLQSVTVAVDVVIENENAFALPAGALDGTLVLGGKQLPVKLSVPPTPSQKKQTLTLRQRVPLNAIASAGLDLAAGRPVSGELTGAVEFGERRQPLRGSFTLRR